MLLTLDIGNTEVTAGLFEADQLRAHWRMTTTAERTPDEWAIALESFVVRAGVARTDLHAACLASVAPVVTQAMRSAVASLAPRVGVVEPRSPLPITVDVDEPMAVGADRLVNVLAAAELHPGDAIVIDLGTATTFDCITADRRFFGGTIMPGLRTSAEQLVRRAAKLTATELLPPERAIGRRTDEQLRGGVLFGTADAIDGMVRRFLAEWPTRETPAVIATGGLASLIAPLTSTITVVDPDLTLHGLRVAARALGLLD